MTTTRDIITGAYQRLGLLPLSATLDPDRTVAGLATYNDMLNAWSAEGIVPGGPTPPIPQYGFCGKAWGYPPHGPSDAPTTTGFEASFDLDDDFPFAPRFVDAAKTLLAIELAPQSGMEPLPSLEKQAEKARNALLAYYVISPYAGQDPAIVLTPGHRRYGLY